MIWGQFRSAEGASPGQGLIRRLLVVTDVHWIKSFMFRHVSRMRTLPLSGRCERTVPTRGRECVHFREARRRFRVVPAINPGDEKIQIEETNAKSFV